MTAEIFIERFYLVLGLVPVCALCQYALGAHTLTANLKIISRLPLSSRAISIPSCR